MPEWLHLLHPQTLILSEFYLTIIMQSFRPLLVKWQASCMSLATFSDSGIFLTLLFFSSIH